MLSPKQVNALFMVSLEYLGGRDWGEGLVIKHEMVEVESGVVPVASGAECSGVECVDGRGFVSTSLRFAWGMVGALMMHYL